MLRRALAGVVFGTALSACAPGSDPSVLGTTTSPLTWTEQQRFVPSTGPGFGAFGLFVQVSGTDALISRHFGGDQPAQSGEAFVFTRAGGSWSQQQILTPSTPFAFGWFGRGLALGLDSALVGAPGEFNDRGAVFRFERTGATWSETQKLSASSGDVGDFFGDAIALDGDVAVVGAPETDGSKGAVYVFERGAGGFAEIARLDGEAAAAGGFGASVAIEGDSVVVGAPDVSAATRPGNAYVFTRTATGFSHQLLAASDGFVGDRFGFSLSLSGDTLVVGAPGATSALDASTSPGAVYVFTRSAGAFVEVAKLAASTPEPNDGFGVSVGVDADRLAVGAPWMDDAYADQGVVSFFVGAGPSWQETQRLVASTAQADGAFGIGVSLDGASLLAGSSDILNGAAYGFALLGAPCSDASACGGGACVDGVCCESACDAACTSCNQPGYEGLCRIVVAGSQDSVCAPYVCSAAGDCQSSCVTTADCAPGSACDSSAHCVATPAANEPGDSSGCGCHSGGQSGSGAGLAGLLLALGLLRRRSSR